MTKERYLNPQPEPEYIIVDATCRLCGVDCRECDCKTGYCQTCSQDCRMCTCAGEGGPAIFRVKNPRFQP